MAPRGRKATRVKREQRALASTPQWCLAGSWGARAQQTAPRPKMAFDLLGHSFSGMTDTAGAFKIHFLPAGSYQLASNGLTMDPFVVGTGDRSISAI